MVNNFLFLGVCVCVTGNFGVRIVVLYMYKGKVLMDIRLSPVVTPGWHSRTSRHLCKPDW